MIWRYRTTLVSTAAFALIASGATAASAADRGNTRHHHQQFSSASSRATVVLGQECSPDGHVCQIPFFGYDTFTGDVAGSQVNAGAVAVDPSTFIGPAVSLANFAGTIAGCPGPGSAILRYTVQLGATPGHNIGTFDVVRDSGTGGLRGLHGRGSLVATPQPDGSFPSVLEADLECDGD